MRLERSTMELENLSLAFGAWKGQLPRTRRSRLPQPIPTFQSGAGVTGEMCVGGAARQLLQQPMGVRVSELLDDFEAARLLQAILPLIVIKPSKQSLQPALAVRLLRAGELGTQHRLDQLAVLLQFANGRGPARKLVA